MPTSEITRMKRRLRRLECILASMQDYVYVFDRQGRYIYANQALLNRLSDDLGIDPDDVIGNDLAELGYPPSLAAKYREQLNEVLTTAEAVRTVETITDPGGSVRNYQYIFIPVLDEHQHVEAVAGVTRDVTSLEPLSIAALEQAEKNSAFVNELHDDFVHLSSSRDIVDVTAQKIARHLGVFRVIISRFDEESDRLETILDWCETDEDVGADEILRVSEILNDAVVGELEALRAIVIDDVSKDSRTSTDADQYRRLGIGSLLQVPYLNEDRLRFEIILYHREPHRWRPDEIEIISDLTGRLWWRLQRAWAEEELQEVNRRKDQFLAVLSHELRNPLSPIELSLPLLDTVAPDSPEGTLARQVIKRQVKQLTRLVDDLLDVNRIDNDKIHLKLEPIDLNELARHTVEDHRPLFHSQKLDLELKPAPEPVFVEGDRNRLAQVIGNLLLNAVKFSKPSGHTVLTVSTDSSSNHAHIHVHDDGVGMEASTMSNLFDPFAQAESSLEHSMGGLGLGLALVRGLVELHDGSVVVASDGLGKGSEFVVSLPLAAADTTAESYMPSPDPTYEQPPRKLLIIEDNPDVARVLQTVLELAGHQIEVSHTGDRGLEKAIEYQPDAILCDIGLPGLSGYDVARRLRDDPELKQIHLIALSGYAGPDDIARAKRAGFDHHLAKPPKLDEIERLLTEGPDRPPQRTSMSQ